MYTCHTIIVELNKKILGNEWKSFIEENMNIQLFSTLTFPTGMSLEVGLSKFHDFWSNLSKLRGEEIWNWYGYDRQPSRAGPSIHFHVLTEFEKSKIVKGIGDWWIETLWSFEIGGNAKVEIYNPSKNGVAYALLKHEPDDRIYCPRVRKSCDRRAQCIYKRDVTKWRKRNLSLV